MILYGEEFPYYSGDMETLFMECKFCHLRRVVGKHPKLRRKLLILIKGLNN